MRIFIFFLKTGIHTFACVSGVQKVFRKKMPAWIKKNGKVYMHMDPVTQHNYYYYTTAICGD